MHAEQLPAPQPAAPAASRYIRDSVGKVGTIQLFQFYSIVADALDEGLTLQQIHTMLASESTARIPASARSNKKPADSSTGRNR